MGCKKLTYYQSEPTLKVVYRKTEPQQKVVQRFLSVDPMAEERLWLSPYNYCQNNPLNLIDPDGMLDDGYTIDDDGNINRVDNTGGEKYDVLYSKKEYEAAKESGKTNADGNPAPENNVKVDDTTILPALAETDSKGISQATTGEQNSTDALSIFKFAADNSNVEWGMAKYNSDDGIKYTVSTMHDPDHTANHKTLGISTSSMISNWHSHPDMPLNMERSSMGATTDGSGGSSDWQRSIFRYNKYNKDTYSENVYFPKSKNFYNIKPWGINLVGNSSSKK